MASVESGAVRRIAMVTGASSGIGRAVAIALGKRGWTVAIGARRTDLLDETADTVRKVGGEAFPFRLDLGREDTIEAFVHAVKRKLGVIDVLINCAGSAKPDAVISQSRNDVRDAFEVNLFGPISLTSKILSDWIESDCVGHVIFISSDQVRTEFPCLIPYGASKCATEFFARGLGKELFDTKIKIGIVRVGATDTGFRHTFDPRKASEMLEFWKKTGVSEPASKRLQPSEVAEAIAYAVDAGLDVSIERLDIRPAFVQ